MVEVGPQKNDPQFSRLIKSGVDWNPESGYYRHAEQLFSRLIKSGVDWNERKIIRIESITNSPG